VEERVDLISLLSGTPQSMMFSQGPGIVLVKNPLEMIPNSHDLFFSQKKKMIQNHSFGDFFFFLKQNEAKMSKCQTTRVFFARPDSYLAVHYPNPDRWMCR